LQATSGKLAMMSLTNQPDNTNLISLLDAWARNMSKGNYIKVRKELMNGNSFLMLPSSNRGSFSTDWHATTATTPIQLGSVYTIDGVKVLGAFTDSDSVLRWSKGKQVNCNSLLSQTILKICEQNGIKRIVINSGSNNIFPLSYYLEDEIQKAEEYW
jgi:hypothetical protein